MKTRATKRRAIAKAPSKKPRRTRAVAPSLPPKPTYPAHLAPLTDEQRMFVMAYLANGGNTTRAYLVVKPDVLVTSAAVDGWRWLRVPAIANALAVERLAAFKRLQMDADEALGRISLCARADIGDAYGETGALLPVNQWPESLRLAVRSIKPETIVLHDALKACELMAQAGGKLKRQVEVTLAELLAPESAGVEAAS